MEPNFNVKTIWNMDEARLKSLDGYLILCDDCFSVWDLGGIYSNLQSIYRIASAKFTNTQGEEIEKLFEELEKIKRLMDDDDNDDESNPVKFYKKCNQMYIKLGRLMKAHGLYFREGKDPTKAALDR